MNAPDDKKVDFLLGGSSSSSSDSIPNLVLQEECLKSESKDKTQDSTVSLIAR